MFEVCQKVLQNLIRYSSNYLQVKNNLIIYQVMLYSARRISDDVHESKKNPKELMRNFGYISVALFPEI